MRLTVPLILASRSPRRRRLLKQLKLEFEVQITDVNEDVTASISPAEVVETLALKKARSVAQQYPYALTLAADTIVVLNDEILGKPVDPDDAANILERLSDATHSVYTGIALLHPESDREQAAHEVTHVSFGRLSRREIEAYVATGSPMDKAGAYGIQDDFGAVFVSRINGDYYNVVGLPLHRFYNVLKAQFEDLVRI